MIFYRFANEFTKNFRARLIKIIRMVDKKSNLVGQLIMKNRNNLHRLTVISTVLRAKAAA
jgi:hypothetical protein